MRFNRYAVLLSLVVLSGCPMKNSDPDPKGPDGAAAAGGAGGARPDAAAEITKLPRPDATAGDPGKPLAEGCATNAECASGFCSDGVCCNSACEGPVVLDDFDDNSHKHAFAVSEDLKYALRECIEALGNEAVRQLRARHEKLFTEDRAAELARECMRYMYRLLFLFYVEARPELGWAPLGVEAWSKGYVPWFGTQLIRGNSLVGGRRDVWRKDQMVPPRSVRARLRPRSRYSRLQEGAGARPACAHFLSVPGVDSPSLA